MPQLTIAHDDGDVSSATECEAMVEVVEKAGASASSVAGEGALNGRIHVLQVSNVNG